MNKLEVYRGPAFRGRLNLNCDYAVRSIKNCAEASLSDTVSENIIGKFLYFYADRPALENPITCVVGRQFAAIHPGQGRAIAAYFKNESSIDSVFLLLGKNPEFETSLLKEITTEYAKSKSLLFCYGKNVSTFGFKEYANPNSNKNLKYMKAIRTAINKHISKELFPIQWTFDYTNSITLQGTNKTLPAKTIIHCVDALGFYESILHLIGKDLETNRFKLVKY